MCQVQQRESEQSEKILKFALCLRELHQLGRKKKFKEELLSVWLSFKHKSHRYI